MLEAYSPSGSEHELAALLREHLSSQGFKVKIDKVGNVIGQAGTKGPQLLLCGHMDTVPGKIRVRQKGGFLYGRGAVDAKSSLAALCLGAALAKERSTLPFRVKLACVVQEETSSIGMEKVIRDGDLYDMAVFGEPSGTSNIVIGYKGSIRVEATCSTNGGHSASPWVSKSSYEELFQFWHKFRTDMLQNEAESKFPAVTGCVTNAVAGDAENSIPSHAKISIDIRIPPSVKPTEFVKKINEFTEEYLNGRKDVQIHVSIKSQTQAYLGQENSSVVLAFRSAIKKLLNGQVFLVKKTGTSDMNLLARKQSIPMIAYGPGDSKLDHTPDERISINEYLTSIEIVASALEKFISLKSKQASAPAR
jgi:LysW-gamma-L-lysine carboxypeptidase